MTTIKKSYVKIWRPILAKLIGASEAKRMSDKAVYDYAIADMADALATGRKMNFHLFYPGA